MITRVIYPLSLREKLSWRIQRLYSHIPEKDIPLEFNKKVTLDLSTTDVGHRSIIFNGFYELGLTRSIVELGNIGGVMVDVGANYGYFSCLWASLNSLNKVIAFEASPVNVDSLINNVRKNGLSEAITVVPTAAGKERGILKFDLNNESQQTGWGGLTIANTPRSIEVEVDTLDSYAEIHNIIKINVLKIDTEGADTWVLYGAERLLKEKRICHIFFEHNVTRMQLLKINVSEAKNFLEKLDYTVVQQSPTDFYAYPTSTGIRK